MDTPSETTRFNRLIDGELSATEYRALLAALDDEPGGWRRCALAFLESQALGQELPAMRRSFDSPAATPAAPPATTESPLGRYGFSLIAIAASFLVAFSLGLVAPRFLSRQPQESFFTGNSPTQNDAQDLSANFNPSNLRNIGNLQLVVDGGDPSETRQLPVYESEPGLNDLLTQESPPIGPELIDLLRRHGYDVQHEQQYLPATLDDGRQMIVPLDGYQITPVSRRY